MTGRKLTRGRLTVTSDSDHPEEWDAKKVGSAKKLMISGRPSVCQLLLFVVLIAVLVGTVVCAPPGGARSASGADGPESLPVSNLLKEEWSTVILKLSIEYERRAHTTDQPDRETEAFIQFVFSLQNEADRLTGLRVVEAIALRVPAERDRLAKLVKEQALKPSSEERYKAVWHKSYLYIRNMRSLGGDAGYPQKPGSANGSGGAGTIEGFVDDERAEDGK